MNIAKASTRYPPPMGEYLSRTPPKANSANTKGSTTTSSIRGNRSKLNCFTNRRATSMRNTDCSPRHAIPRKEARNDSATRTRTNNREDREDIEPNSTSVEDVENRTKLCRTDTDIELAEAETAIAFAKTMIAKERRKERRTKTILDCAIEFDDKEAAGALLQELKVITDRKIKAAQIMNDAQALCNLTTQKKKTKAEETMMPCGKSAQPEMEAIVEETAEHIDEKEEVTTRGEEDGPQLDDINEKMREFDAELKNMVQQERLRVEESGAREPKSRKGKKKTRRSANHSDYGYNCASQSAGLVKTLIGHAKNEIGEGPVGHILAYLRGFARGCGCDFECGEEANPNSSTGANALDTL